MTKKLNCEQVISLLNLYLDETLNPVLKELVDIHISNCGACKKKFEELKNILFKYDKDKLSIVSSENKNNSMIKKLSAYIDNELSADDNIKIKKITISNPNARKKLESMYKFQKLLHSAYEKTKQEIKTDYSRSIVSMINETSEDYSTEILKKIAIVFVILLITILSGFIYLYF